MQSSSVKPTSEPATDSLPNFRVYRTDREDARGGGTAILIKSTTLTWRWTSSTSRPPPPRLTWRPARSNSSLPTKLPEDRSWRTTYRRSLTPLERLSSPKTSTPSTIVELVSDERKRHLSTPLCRRPPPAGGRYRRAHNISA
ncbi:hypothetical protein Trydic_g1537 [Trypoxylus dichotomus]